jgi:hypothetical protein
VEVDVVLVLELEVVVDKVVRVVVVLTRQQVSPSNNEHHGNWQKILSALSRSTRSPGQGKSLQLATGVSAP